MTLFKWLLLVVLVLLTAAVVTSGYFLYKLTNLQTIGDSVKPLVSEVSLSVPTNVSSTVALLATTTAATSTVYSIPATGFVVPISALPSGQQSLARALGFTTELIITPEAVACAKGKIGTERVEAISSGAVPTLMESIALLGCV